MSGRLRLCIFAHSWRSDWNHGNAHFLRGLAHELTKLGHEVACYEPEQSWSLINLLQEGERGRESLEQFKTIFSHLDVRSYGQKEPFERFAKRELRGADIVLVHEWNSPDVVNTILSLKREFGFRALFHDTHHRAYTNPKEILRLNLQEFDGVLAFGETLRRIYLEAFGVPRVWTFHEAADTAHFSPISGSKQCDITWIGNWGDEERSRELEEFLIGPAIGLPSRRTVVYGVRYSPAAKAKLGSAGIQYRGYLPNLMAPRVYSESAISLHVPRKFYSNGLSGIPTIRVFEALACGTPLLCSPWADTDGLFRKGEDYLCVPDEKAMRAEIEHLLNDDAARSQIAANGLDTIRRRHTCAHRTQQLLEICEELEK